MANQPIHEQSQALSAYFDDMLTTPATITKATSATESAITEMPSNDSAAQPEMVNEAPLSEVDEQPENLRVLLCDIDGLNLAVPVSEVNNIVRWPQQGLNVLPEKPSWQLGVINQPQTSQVIDIRHLLQTEARLKPIQANYIVLVDDHRWGIACHHIQHIVTYQADSINWHDQQSQPSWRRGVITEGNYQIIDIPALLLTLKQS